MSRKLDRVRYWRRRASVTELEHGPEQVRGLEAFIARPIVSGYGFRGPATKFEEAEDFAA